MKRSLGALAAGLVLAASTVAGAAPYEDYKVQIQRAQDAKRKVVAADALQANEDRAAMQEHMRLMQEMNEQMQQVRQLDKLTPEQMRNWITQHAQLMEKMHQQMMRENHRRQGGGSMMHGAPN